MCQKHLTLYFFYFIVPNDGMINGTITDIEANVLSCLRDNPHLTAAEIAEKIGKSLRTVNRILSSLKSKDLAVRVGSNKNGYWRVQ